MGFRRPPGEVSLFFQAVFVRIAADDLDAVADNTPAGCIYERTPPIEHATNEPAHAGAPRIERSTTWMNSFEEKIHPKSC